MAKKWKTLETKTIFKNSWFDIKEEKVQISDTLAMEGVIVLHFRDWVNIVAVTSANQMILERNYRHGRNTETVETPSGSVEETDKSHSEAAHRELLEETGYAAKKMIYLGSSYSNAQLCDNMIHHYLALDCQLVDQPKPEFEGRVEFWTESIDSAYKRIEKNEIQQSYIIEGLLRAKPWIDQLKSGAV